MYIDFDFFEVRLHIASSLAAWFVRIRVYEELSLADNLINERSIFSDAAGNSRLQKSLISASWRGMVRESRTSIFERKKSKGQVGSRCDGGRRVEPVRCDQRFETEENIRGPDVYRKKLALHIRREGRRKEGNRKKF